MSPLGKDIMAAKRKRAEHSRSGDREGFWGLTHFINWLVRRG